MDIFLATLNKGKVKELEALLTGQDVRVLSLADYPDFPEVDETGESFSQNALLKAKTGAMHTQLITLADDSGLEVDVLDGAPGVYSARYAGEPKNDDQNTEKLLQDLQGVPEQERTARFRCCLALVVPEDEQTNNIYREMVTEGTVEGLILNEKRGSGGFGYDPVFYLPELGKTMAELTMEEKNRLSHRSQAFQKAVPILKELLERK